MAFEPYEDVHLGYAALSAIRCHCMNGTFDGGKQLERLERLLALADMQHKQHSHDRSSARLWLRETDKDGFETYISLSPGGFRRKPPPSKDLVVDSIDLKPTDFFSKTLESIVKDYSEEPLVSSEVKAAKRLLHGCFDEESRQRLATFEELYQLPARQAKAKLEVEIADLYEDNLFSYGMSVIDFSSAMALVQLHAGGAIRLEEFPRHEELRVAVREIGKHATDNIKAREPLQMFLDAEYSQAKECRSRAVQSRSLMEHHRYAYTACHFLLNTLDIVREFRNDLVTFRQADEAFSCC